MFPYVRGLEFARAVARARGGLRGLDGVLADPPASTEQVLHPEKYLAAVRDAPVAVETPRLGGRRPIRSGTRGEWGILVELDAGLSRRCAEAAAAGWGGDAFAVFEGESGDGDEEAAPPVLVWETRWDTERDAREFAAAYEAFARNTGALADVERGPGARVRVRAVPARGNADRGDAAR
jgi:hypothetical protein